MLYDFNKVSKPFKIGQINVFSNYIGTHLNFTRSQKKVGFEVKMDTQEVPARVSTALRGKADKVLKCQNRNAKATVRKNFQQKTAV